MSEATEGRGSFRKEGALEKNGQLHYVRSADLAGLQGL